MLSDYMARMEIIPRGDSRGGGSRGGSRACSRNGSAGSESFPAASNLSDADCMPDGRTAAELTGSSDEEARPPPRKPAQKTRPENLHERASRLACSARAVRLPPRASPAATRMLRCLLATLRAAFSSCPSFLPYSCPSPGLTLCLPLCCLIMGRLTTPRLTLDGHSPWPDPAHRGRRRCRSAGRAPCPPRWPRCAPLPRKTARRPQQLWPPTCGPPRARSSPLARGPCCPPRPARCKWTSQRCTRRVLCAVARCGR